MSMKALEALYKDNSLEDVLITGIKEQELLDSQDIILQQIDETFDQVAILVKARNAVDRFTALDRNEIGEEAYAIEKKHLLTVIPEAVLEAAGGEEDASEGFFTKIKNVLTRFFTSVFESFIKRVLGMNYEEQAVRLSAMISKAPNFLNKEVSIKNIDGISFGLGSGIYPDITLSKALMTFSGIDRHFDGLWKLAINSGGKSFEEIFPKLAGSLFPFHGKTNKGYGYTAFMKSSDAVLTSMHKLDQKSIDWKITGRTMGGTVKVKAGNSKEAISVLSQVNQFTTGLTKLAKLSADRWSRDIPVEWGERVDDMRLRNTLKFIYGIVTYFRNMVQDILRWYRACLATVQTTQPKAGN